MNATDPSTAGILPDLALARKLHQHLIESAGLVDAGFQEPSEKITGDTVQRLCPDIAGHNLLLLGAGRISRILALAAASSARGIWILARRTEQGLQLAGEIRLTYPECPVFCLGSFDKWQAVKQEQAGPWALLNGTPVGQWPAISEMPLPPSAVGHFNWICDVICAPAASRLVLLARSRGIPAVDGLTLLFRRILAAVQEQYPKDVFSASILKTAHKQLIRSLLTYYPLTLILNGFMGCGKTTVGEQLAGSLGLPLIDLDQSIEQTSGRSIPEIFASSGESYFREMERQQLAGMLEKKRSQILSVGGGALIAPASGDLVHRFPAFVIYLDTPLEIIKARVGDGQGRPLLYQQDECKIESLFLTREPRYLEIADLKVSGAGTPAQTAAMIAAGLGYEMEE